MDVRLIKKIDVVNPENNMVERIEFSTYGFMNADKLKNDNIEYKAVVGNIVWSIILCETIIAPILLLGWHMYEPVGIKSKKKPMYKGAVSQKHIPKLVMPKILWDQNSNVDGNTK